MNEKSDESISGLIIDDQISAKKISNHFNNFFTNVAEKINKNFVNLKKTQHLSYLSLENSNTILFSLTLPEDIEDLISSMKKQNLKLFKKQCLSEIINLSANQGVFQNLLKIANVIPIHKKDDKLGCNNYRLISLLSNISKIYEKGMHIRSTNFFRMNLSSSFLKNLFSAMDTLRQSNVTFLILSNGFECEQNSTSNFQINKKSNL